jgi:SAM-dependent methyltransferase
MIKYVVERLLGKRGRKNLPLSRFTREVLHAIGADEALLYEAISYNVNKNDRALYNLLHCAKLINDSANSLGETLSGKTILELGTSREPGLPLILLLLGCQDYYASNIRSLDNWLPDAYIGLIRLVMSGMLGNPPNSIEEIVTWVEGKGVSGHNTTGRLREECFHDLSPVSADSLDLPDGSMDVVFSLAVLEHVHRPQAVIDNIYRMVRPGGWCFHAIDLRDHRDFDNPLEFLTIDETNYRALRPNGENRWRASDFIDAFSSAGFEIVTTSLVDKPMRLNADRNCDIVLDIVEPSATAARLEECSTWVSPEQRATFKPPFSEQSLQDLSVLSMSLLCRKPL